MRFEFPISICITLRLCLIVIFDGVKLLIRVVRPSYLSFHSVVQLCSLFFEWMNGIWVAYIDGIWLIEQ